MSEYQCPKCKSTSTTTAFCGTCNCEMMMCESEKEDERKRCYLCDKEILQLPGQEFKLQCEKGPPITVCEDCYENAETEF